MTNKIITDSKILHTVSQLTSFKEVEELNLIQRLKAANDTAWVAGTGLAAIQIGIPLRFAWFKWGEEEFTLLNPVILSSKGKAKRLQEGCLSIPDTYVFVKRYYKITYQSGTEGYKAKGLKAQIIQHEIDHMNGILITD